MPLGSAERLVFFRSALKRRIEPMITNEQAARRVLAILAIAMAACIGHAGPRTYLTTVGPAPMRLAARCTSAPAPLPAPNTGSEGSLASRPGQTSSAEPWNPAAIGGQRISQESEALLDADSRCLTNGISLSLGNQASPAISPESLLHFFTDPNFTNAQVGVTVPLNFQPAMPPVQRSSSAIYRSSPEP